MALEIPGGLYTCRMAAFRGEGHEDALHSEAQARERGLDTLRTRGRLCERVGESFAAPADEIERLYPGLSVLHCLPVGMSEQPSVLPPASITVGRG